MYLGLEGHTYSGLTCIAMVCDDLESIREEDDPIGLPQRENVTAADVLRY